MRNQPCFSFGLSALLLFTFPCAHGEEVVSNLGQSKASTLYNVSDSFSFRVGANDYQLNSITCVLKSHASLGGEYRAALHLDLNGKPGTKVLDFQSVSFPSGVDDKFITFKPQVEQILPAGGVNWIKISGPPSDNYWRLTQAKVETSADGWSIGDYGIRDAATRLEEFVGLFSVDATRIVYNPPNILNRTADTNVIEGGAVTLAVEVAGSTPFIFRWFKDGSAIPNGALNPLALANLSEADSGTYTVLVSNRAGDATSLPIQLTVLRDADGDGLSDSEEAGLGTSQLDRDSDADGLTDFAEVRVYGTDPTKADTDGDGLTDGIEVREGFDPKSATEGSDAKLIVERAIALSFATQSGQRNQLQWSRDLLKWINDSEPFSGTGDNNTVYRPYSNTGRFWRLLTLEPPGLPDRTVVQSRAVLLHHFSLQSHRYQLQHTTNFQVWHDDGTPYSGTGSFREFDRLQVDGARFWRVIPVP